MGVGTPLDIVQGVARGIDIFDCVNPTRLARHKTAITRNGRLNITKKIYEKDPSPLVADCSCYACQELSPEHISDILLESNEILGPILLSIHNLDVLIDLSSALRKEIIEGSFQTFLERIPINTRRKWSYRMTFFQSIVLGIIQGASEFLPISSSGHLVLAPYLFSWEISPQRSLCF